MDRNSLDLVTSVHKESSSWTVTTMGEPAIRLRCYSRLRRILCERGITVAELARLLAKRGTSVNIKTLYRLADPTVQIERLEMTVTAGVCEVLGIDLSALLTFEAFRREAGLRRLSSISQKRLDVLLRKQAEGRISAREARELRDRVDEAERLTLENARKLARARVSGM